MNWAEHMEVISRLTGSTTFQLSGHDGYKMIFEYWSGFPPTVIWYEQTSGRPLLALDAEEVNVRIQLMRQPVVLEKIYG